MAQETNNNQLYKCPHCACIFLNQADLQKHLTVFGTKKSNMNSTTRKHMADWNTATAKNSHYLFYKGSFGNKFYKQT